MGDLGDKRLKEAFGDIMKRLREVEANAQTPGKCVTIVADPAVRELTVYRGGPCQIAAASTTAAAARQ